MANNPTTDSIVLLRKLTKTRQENSIQCRRNILFYNFKSEHLILRLCGRNMMNFQEHIHGKLEATETIIPKELEQAESTQVMPPSS